jgi:hypothetical protein
VREVVARFADGSEVGEFKSRYCSSTVCLHAAVHGHACGVLGNNGPIDPDGAAKATQFLQLCEQADLPSFSVIARRCAGPPASCDGSLSTRPSPAPPEYTSVVSRHSASGASRLNRV